MIREDGLPPYADWWVYKEFSGTINRFLACLVHKTNRSKKTLSWARYVKSVAEGRILWSTEHVDHIDNNPLNDDPANLQILTQAENNRKSGKSARMSELVCFFCGKTFERPTRAIRAARCFCSKSCVGKQARLFDQVANLRA